MEEIKLNFPEDKLGSYKGEPYDQVSLVDEPVGGKTENNSVWEKAKQHFMKEMTQLIGTGEQLVFSDPERKHGVVLLPWFLAVCLMMFFLDLVWSEVWCQISADPSKLPASEICVEALGTIPWGSFNPSHLSGSPSELGKILLMQLHHWDRRHLLLNLCFLSVPLYLLERFFGPFKVLFICLSGALWSGAGVLIFRRDGEYAGVSGICMTLMWCLLVERCLNFSYHRRLLVPIVMMVLLVIQTILEISFFNHRIASMAHIGGSLAGVIASFLCCPYWMRQRSFLVRGIWLISGITYFLLCTFPCLFFLLWF